MGVIGDEGLREDEAAAACRPGDEMLKKKRKTSKAQKQILEGSKQN